MSKYLDENGTKKIIDTLSDIQSSLVSLSSFNLLNNTRKMPECSNTDYISYSVDDDGFTVAKISITDGKAYAAFLLPKVPCHDGDVFTFSVDVMSDDEPSPYHGWIAEFHMYHTGSGQRIVSHGVMRSSITNYPESGIIQHSGTPFEKNIWQRRACSVTWDPKQWSSSQNPTYSVNDADQITFALSIWGNGTVYYKKPKLERGVVPCPVWTPSVNDLFT